MKAQIVRQVSVQSTLSTAASPRRQRGAVIVLTAIAMLVLLGVAAMSLDGGHMILNNARLQNIVDAAALEGAHVLSNNGTSQEAADAAEALLLANALDLGYQEINAEIGGGSANIEADIDFNDTLVPFPQHANHASSTSYTFIRVTVNNLPLRPWFMQIFGLSKGVSVSAVSAAVHDVDCDIVPVVLCAANPADPFGLGGYVDGQLATLKLAAGDDKDLGPGNFRLLKLRGGNGPPNVMINLAGSFSGCPDEFDTKPGNNVGPVVKGINSRFYDPTKPPLAKPKAEELYQADHFDNSDFTPSFPGDFPGDSDDDPALSYNKATNIIEWTDPDGDIHPLDPTLAPKCSDNTVGDFDQYCFGDDDSIFSRSNYRAEYAKDNDWELDEGRFERRIIGVPVATCEGDTGGSVPAEVIGLGCFFLMQPAIPKGPDAHIFGEFIEECSEFPFPESGAEIVLYKDPLKTDS